MFCSWLAFSLGSVHMFFSRFSFIGSTWQHIRVPHHSILMQENQVWSLDNIICYGILGTSGTSMNLIHVIMMPYHKFSCFFGCRLPWNGCRSKNVRLFRTAIVIHRLGVFFFSYRLLLSLALWPYLVPLKLLNLALCKKKILRHIKLAVHAWSTKCRWNQKLIAQFSCTLRDERFEPN
jgi:hypothetical protein